VVVVVDDVLLFTCDVHNGKKAFVADIIDNIATKYDDIPPIVPYFIYNMNATSIKRLMAE